MCRNEGFKVQGAPVKLRGLRIGFFEETEVAKLAQRQGQETLIGCDDLIEVARTLCSARGE
jgi:hypothetical protein